MLFQRFVHAAASRLLPSTRVAVAYSGGLDSTVLLHLFLRLRASQSFDLQAFHLHHGLSPNADAWLAHCARVCERTAVPFSSSRADLSHIAGASLEARARTARYQAYEMLNAELVVLAHHQDDQAETVLYRLARGAGVQGAAGMPAMRPLGAGKQIWRPLLAEPRSALLEYAQQHELSWVEDESNVLVDYDRNFLRHVVVPPLVSRFPSAQAALARAARHFSEAAGLLDSLAKMDAVDEAPSLDMARLRSLSEARQHNLLRWFLAKHALWLEERQLTVLLGQVLHAREDATPFLRLGDVAVRRYRERLWVAPLPPNVQATELGLDGLLPTNWGGQLSWSRQAGGVADAWRDGLVARPRMGGERLRPRTGGPTRPVKDLLQEAGVPPWLRSYWPLIWRGDVLVAVAGIAVAAQCQDECGWWPRWQPEGWPDAP
ncbi:tRNA lysidine(34) synthetase TilS [Chitinimonas sp. BJB300]|uniref:tRNA lysidine(34) synthetase TilS n=1 Tax=Chitinimonas sp. BJB300 TaxID=1559339 RepID=UPI001304260A|nr:tRNA lysidine(34) synthetase TilS [Chitinimonas sp. BJB300]